MMQLLIKYGNIVLTTTTVHRVRYHLWLLLLVHLTGYIVNLSDFYSYTIIGKLTPFFNFRSFGQNWKGWERSGEKGLIISDNHAQTCLIITINDTSTGDLPLIIIITISDTCKNQTKRLDFDNTINLSSLIVSLGCHSTEVCCSHCCGLVYWFIINTIVLFWVNRKVPLFCFESTEK